MKNVYEVLAEHYELEMGEEFELVTLGGTHLSGKKFKFTSLGLFDMNGMRCPNTLALLIAGGISIKKVPLLRKKRAKMLNRTVKEIGCPIAHVVYHKFDTDDGVRVGFDFVGEISMYEFRSVLYITFPMDDEFNNLIDGKGYTMLQLGLSEEE